MTDPSNEVEAATPAPSAPAGYVVEGDKYRIEALGLLKDWVTAILQLETAVIGAVGGAITFKSAAELKLTSPETLAVAIATLLMGASLFSGLILLNMLPGAAQRSPTGAALHDDIYSIRIFERTIGDWTYWFRNGFFLGVGAIVVFILLRLSDH